MDRRRPPARLGAPGHGGLERPVDLADAGAVAEAAERPAVGGGQPVARQLEQGARRDVEEDGPRAGASSASERTRWPVTTSPPAEVTASTIASVTAALPPSTTGQPTAWASEPRNSPIPAVTGWSRRSIEWAATPANRARASSVSKRRATEVAERSASAPNAAIRSGWGGTERIDDRTVPATSSR